ncbi:hypothetical protein [Rhizobium phaseoli]|uniref:Metallo-beta-lactamase domain-containing protein n=1 Tax=Rhizobium phaseoli TaxID=396 RepID=A0ABN4QU72_9HYPH|nr:hypothetical protein [Rhizobium phaseoli]ANL87888.1 hypothetical protein AMC81_PD00031 [Rhizobium phaseoli]
MCIRGLHAAGLPSAPDGVAEDNWRYALEVACLIVGGDRYQAAGDDMGAAICRGILNANFPGWRERVDIDVMRRAAQITQNAIEEKEWQEALRSSARMRLPASDLRAWPRLKNQAVAHRRLQCPVGQGGFHAGIVRHALNCLAPEFSDDASSSIFYIYDCGSERRRHVDPEIRKVVAGRGVGKPLDFLFLSHFDRDHINGVPLLLHETKGLRVDTVVLPYVDEAERLMAFGKAINRSKSAGSDRFFTDMILDPVAALQAFGPRQIIFVTGEPGPRRTPEAPPVHSPSSPEDGRPYWKAVSDDHAGAFGFRQVSGAVIVDNLSFQIFGGMEMGGWRLVPYVERADLDVIERFECAIEILQKWDRGSFQKKTRDLDIRKELITTYQIKVAQAYKYAAGNRNVTSLCLYSGPAAPEMAGAIDISPGAASANLAKVGWLGTGDAELRSDAAIEQFKRHYFSELPFTSTFVLPHHGSINNSDPLQLFSDVDRFVAAAWSKRWQHPSNQLVSQIENLDRDFRHVTAEPGTALNEACVVFWP